MRKFWLGGLALALILTLTAGALAQDDAGTGALTIVANGEDFVRQGFVSKDGWAMSFDALYINVTDVVAYQSDPPYTPEDEEALSAEIAVELPGPHWLDLAAGDADADPIEVGVIEDAPEGFYNAMSWALVPVAEDAEDADYAGYSLVLIGSAEREGETVAFELMLAPEWAYWCGEYVGDERLGFLWADDEAALEFTLHFDHIFGDAELDADDDLNVDALGFDPLAALAEDGVLVADADQLADALSADDWQVLDDAVRGLGHVGEGHCHVTPLEAAAEAE